MRCSSIFALLMATAYATAHSIPFDASDNLERRQATSVSGVPALPTGTPIPGLAGALTSVESVIATLEGALIASAAPVPALQALLEIVFGAVFTLESTLDVNGVTSRKRQLQLLQPLLDVVGDVVTELINTIGGTAAGNQDVTVPEFQSAVGKAVSELKAAVAQA